MLIGFKSSKNKMDQFFKKIHKLIFYRKNTEINSKVKFQEIHQKEIIFKLIKRFNKIPKKMVKKYNLKLCRYHQKDKKKVSSKNKQ